jgi:murein L,D-transpeptidase YcbB/YkuD
VLALWFCCALGYPPGARAQALGAQSLSASAQAELKSLVGNGSLPDLRWPDFGDHRAEVAELYESGGYALAWIQDNRPIPQALTMIRLFKDSALKGLNPEDYDAPRWDGRIAIIQAQGARPAESDLVHFDLALTVCAMRFISDLHGGRVSPQRFKFDLQIGPVKYDLAQLLRNQILKYNDVEEVVPKVEPGYGGYRRAETALAAYLKLASEGDGDPLPMPEKAIRPGKAYAGMPQLIRRLRQLGDLAADPGTPTDSDIYQGAAVAAVERFQRRHGLDVDGRLGPQTVARLNLPLSLRVAELRYALERYRWIPSDFPEPPIVVNIPEFRLHTIAAQGEPSLSMGVVVGKAYRSQTPVFADKMRYVVFRPYWNVPPSIQRHELIPKVRRNRNYLADNDFEVVDGSERVVTSGRVSDAVLDGLVSGELRIRQIPGDTCSVGLIKFVFPNRHNVYLHGTPAMELFSRARRDFSHGCIRVEDPVALAAWVLRDRPEWTVERIRAAMEGDDNVQVNLTHPIPVLILYSTAVVEPDGEVRFFDDIYGYDEQMDKALASGYPYAG